LDKKHLTRFFVAGISYLRVVLHQTTRREVNIIIKEKKVKRPIWYTWKLILIVVAIGVLALIVGLDDFAAYILVLGIPVSLLIWVIGGIIWDNKNASGREKTSENTTQGNTTGAYKDNKLFNEKLSMTQLITALLFGVAVIWFMASDYKSNLLEPSQSTAAKTEPIPELLTKSELLIGDWECRDGTIYTKRFTSDGRYESFGGGSTHYKGTYFVDGNELIVDYGDANSSGYKYETRGVYNIFTLTKYRLVTGNDNGLVSCAKIK
jgi:hypothetical protein